MEKIYIKKISEVNEVQLKEFYTNVFKFEKSVLENYKWRYRIGHNNCEPIVLIVNNKICGHAGLIPTDIKLNNIKEKAIWFTDLFIESNYRSKGYGKLLTEEWMKICPLQITMCNNDSLNLFKKLCWNYNQSFVRKIKIINYLNIFPFIKNLRKKETLVNSVINDLDVNEVKNNNLSKIIELSEHISSGYESCLIRDENWFKWRVLDCPYKKDILIFSHNEEYVIGHILKKNGFKRLNIIFSTHNINSNIFKLISKWLKINGFDYLAYIDYQTKPVSNFLPTSKSMNFAFFSKSDSELNTIKNSFKDIQYIDSDIDFI